MPEAFGEAHLVNGKLFPYLDVEPRKYRFRILNAANGRFYRLSLSGGGADAANWLGPRAAGRAGNDELCYIWRRASAPMW